MTPQALISEQLHEAAAGAEPRVAEQGADASLDHVLAELRRLDLDGVLSADGGQRIVRRDPYGGSFELGLRAFSELASTVADGSGLRGFYLARDGFRDDDVVRAINAELARCALAGYSARHRTSGAENGIVVTDVLGRELPRPARDPHGRELMQLLGTLADGSGPAAYAAALVDRDGHWRSV
ncbi:MAG: hypothetical protein QOI71_1982 [Gaiellales bacterium]|jgi:hypothetical protein|nr:hypothetical protein [Gaiellales bacterium]